MHAQRADGSRRSRFVTTFSRREVADQPLTAVLAVVPVELTDDAQVVADQIVLSAPTGEDGPFAQAVIRSGQGECVVTLTTNGVSFARR